MHTIVVYVPESHLEQVKKAMFENGAGNFGLYDCCSWQVKGSGQFRPLQGSTPHLGNTDQKETVPEYKVEMICRDSILKKVLQAMLKAHPYETPAYAAMPVITLKDLQ